MVGGGGHCKSCIDVIEREGKYQISGIIDIPEKKKQRILDYEIIGSDDELFYLSKVYNNFLITIGQIKSPEKRISLFNQLVSFGINFPVIISPHAYISKYAYVGNGTIIMHGAIINAGATIGKNCIINTSALIEHDAIIGDHCHISTSSVINGGTEIGKSSFIGSNTVVREYIRIGENSIVGAGLRVMDDLKDYSLKRI